MSVKSTLVNVHLSEYIAEWIMHSLKNNTSAKNKMKQKQNMLFNQAMPTKVHWSHISLYNKILIFITMNVILQ